MSASPRATAVSQHTVLPPSDLEGMTDLSRFLDGLTQPAALLGPDGQTVPLPIEAFHALCDVVAAMQLGKAIVVAPVDQMLTTQEAANFLGISRPTLVKLVESGEIPHEVTSGGRHRRVRLHDLVAYQERQRHERRNLLDQITVEAQADGLYEVGADTYQSALAEARRTRQREAS